jgi:hypothetical protein
MIHRLHRQPNDAQLPPKHQYSLTPYKNYTTSDGVGADRKDQKSLLEQGQRTELANTLAKEATTKVDIPLCYEKVPRSVMKRELECTSIDKWQTLWNQNH